MGKKNDKIEKINVTEEDGIHVQWYKDAQKVTRDTLPKFISHLMDDYNHDYGTYVHAVTACALATTWACGSEMTGVQASMISILYPRNLYYNGVSTGISIRNWDEMLYPQYENKFDKIISKRMWEAIQSQAVDNLESHSEHASEKVVKHWKSIVDGVVPFGYKVIDPDADEPVEDVQPEDYEDNINAAE